MWNDLAFWKLVNETNRPGVQFSAQTYIDWRTRENLYNLFEVMVAVALSKEMPDFHWYATRRYSDQGIDFIGEYPTYYYSAIDFRIETHIVGQVKIENPGYTKSYVWEVLGRIREIEWDKKEAISHVYFVIGGSDWSDGNFKSLRESIDNPKVNHAGPGKVVVVDVQRILNSMVKNRNLIIQALEGAVYQNEKEVISRYLAAQSVLVPHFSVHIEVKTASIGETGKPILVVLNINADASFSEIKLKLRYLRSESEEGIVDVVSPISIANSNGLDFKLMHNSPRFIEIYFRSFYTGDVALGTILIFDESGKKINRVELPKASVSPSFNPRFYTKANATILQTGRSVVLDFLNGDSEAIIVTGGGGGGKSSICNYLLDDARNSGAHIISVEHENKLTSQGSLLRSTIKILANDDCSLLSDKEWIDGFLNLPGSFPTDAKLAYRSLFLSGSEGNTSGLVKGLIYQISKLLQIAPVVLYWSDLHWAGKDTLDVIEQLWECFRNARKDGRHRDRILFLLEGRNKDNLPVQGGAFESPVSWQAFLSKGAITKILLVEPWTISDSKNFIYDLITVDPGKNESGRKLQDAPQAEELTNHVLRNANGNPLHLLEQLKWLYAHEIISYTSYGQIYLKGSLSRIDKIPEKLEELIRSRIDYIKGESDVIIPFLALFSQIGKEVQPPLFKYLARVGRIDDPIRTIKKMDVISIEEGKPLRFLHENYYRYFKSIDSNITPDLLSIAVSWFQGLQNPTLDDQFCMIRLLYIQLQYDLNVFPILIGKFQECIQSARESNSYFVLAGILDLAFSLGSSVLRNYSVDVLDWRLLAISVKLCAEHAESALIAVEDLEEECLAWPDRRQAWLFRASGQARAADILLGLMRYEDGLRTVAKGLMLIDSLPMNTSVAQVKAELLHRKAVLHWFSGNAKSALPLQIEARRVCEKDSVHVERVVTLRELGTLLLHASPRLGIRVLDRAHSFFCKVNVPINRTEENIILAQKLMGELILAQSMGPEKVLEIGQRAADQYRICETMVDTYDTVRCALVAGAANALVSNFDNAVLWFGLARTIANRVGLLEDLWMARLNLAQLAVQTGMHEEMMMNGQLALDHLTVSLKGVSAATNASRARLLMLPLLHLNRMHIIGNEEIIKLTGLSMPAFAEYWHLRPAAVSRDLLQQQPLHVRNGDFDYFLMN